MAFLSQQYEARDIFNWLRMLLWKDGELCPCALLSAPLLFGIEFKSTPVQKHKSTKLPEPVLGLPRQPNINRRRLDHRRAYS